MSNTQIVGSVMVVGGGIAGIQASLDLANSGYKVYLIEKTSSIGGVMSQLDKTFPTNDCSMCIISPKLVEAGRHLNIELFTLSEVKNISGKEGNFEVFITQKARYIDMDKCIACGACADKCPKKVDDIYNEKLTKRKAIYLKYPQAVPLKYVIDKKNCIYFKNGKCRACEKFCPANAINFEDESKDFSINVGSVILSPGFKPFDPKKVDDTYNYESHPNVLTSLEFERILSASGPYQGHLLRPSDKKHPKKIAWLQCIGSRDINNCDNEYCSSVCCMYANKQAIIAKEHSEKSLDTVIFFMDMRTFGKDFDKYVIRGQEESGIRHIRSRIHSVIPYKNDCLRIVYSTETGGMVEDIFDLVILSIGLSSSITNVELAKKINIELDKNGYAVTSNLNSVSSSKNGIYVCGSFQEPKDIPMSVTEASASSALASELLSEARWTLTKEKKWPAELNIAGKDPRIGVFVCNCGINIGGIIDVPSVRDYAMSLPYVVYVEDNLFTCSQDSQDHIKEIIHEKSLNRILIASCSPRTHEPLFQETIRDAGLNRHLFEMANIRDQNSWVHMDNPEKATQKAKELVRMGIAKVIHTEPLYQVSIKITKSALVIGGGIAGMEAALGVAKQGCKVILIEKTENLGGNAMFINHSWQEESIPIYLKNLIKNIKKHPMIELHTKTKVKTTTGSVGNFKTKLVSVSSRDEEIIIYHGATIVAVGGQEFKSTDYFYGKNPRVFTHIDFDMAFSNNNKIVKDSKNIVFLQCVGSRNENRPYCSKVCCTHSLKSAIALKKANSKRKIIIIYREIRSYGFREKLYTEARENGILFIRYDLKKPPEISSHSNDKITLRVIDHVLQKQVDFNLDLLILATGILPNENKELYQELKLPVNSDGFLVEAHSKLRPVDFSSDGFFLAGIAHYPKPIEESIAQAKAAASRVMTILSKDKVKAGGMITVVDSTKCAACLTCVRVCPYNIPCVKEHNYAVIEAAQCHGCGICVSECPGKALSLKHFTDDQLIAKTEALFSIYQN